MGISLEKAKDLWKRQAASSVRVVPAAFGRGFSVCLEDPSDFANWMLGRPYKGQGKPTLGESLAASALVFDTSADAERMVTEINGEAS